MYTFARVNFGNFRGQSALPLAGGTGIFHVRIISLSSYEYDKRSLHAVNVKLGLVYFYGFTVKL